MGHGTHAGQTGLVRLQRWLSVPGVHFLGVQGALVRARSTSASKDTTLGEGN